MPGWAAAKARNTLILQKANCSPDPLGQLVIGSSLNATWIFVGYGPVSEVPLATMSSGLEQGGKVTG